MGWYDDSDWNTIIDMNPHRDVGVMGGCIKVRRLIVIHQVKILLMMLIQSEIT